MIFVGNSRENCPLFTDIPLEVCCGCRKRSSMGNPFKKRLEKYTESVLKIRGLLNSHAPAIKRPIIEGMARAAMICKPRANPCELAS